ncbi:unnamed protein product [Lathyrus sativus]|nr:unnamed protein product [Lathyrus sativus]
MRGLVKHLKSGAGTLLLRDGVKGVYIYELFNKEGAGRNWGLLYPNGSTKYDVDFSEASRSSLVNWINVAFLLIVVIECVCLVDELANRTMRPCLSKCCQSTGSRIDERGLQRLQGHFFIQAAIALAKKEGLLVFLDLASFKVFYFRYY